MKKVIITGATGFVGANLTRRLLQEGCDVHLLLRPDHQTWRIKDILADVHLHRIELVSGRLVCVIKRIRPEWIFHLAVYGGSSSQVDWRCMLEANIAGTMNLLEACLAVGFDAFVNTGSSSEYGYKDHAPSEKERLDPNSCYAVTKACATHYCRFIAQRHRVNIPTLRLYSVYGSYEDPKRFLPTLIIHGLRQKLPPLVGPEISRDFVYVDDICDAYIMAASRPTRELGSIYNVGTGRQTTIRQVVQIARKVMGIEDIPRWGSMPNRQWDTEVWRAQAGKIRRELEWNPRYSFQQGFVKMVNWFMANSELIRYYRTRIKE